ncbi:MAG: OmpA family protein [Desulfatiglandaceae bacterium]
MEDLKQAALSAIHEADDPSCSVRWNQNRLVFVLGERLTFPVGQANLLHNFRPTLRQIADLIASKTDYRIMVSGHTDDTPIATSEFPSNWELSAARAITVAKSIIESGVDPHRISIQGYGEYHPLHPNSSPENRQANRRVEIALFKQQATENASEALY